VNRIMVDVLRSVVADAEQHFRAICNFSSAKPMRAAVDMQSYEDLKPGVLLSFAVLEWYNRLSGALVAMVSELATAPDGPTTETARSLLLDALDACVLIECQYAGWSNAMNRFSWFKRTVQALGNQVAAEPDMPQIKADMQKFQSFIGNAQFPIGLHMTGPLRTEVKKVEKHERVLMAALEHGVKRAAGPRPADSELRPLPVVMVFADGELTPGSFNVFTSGSPALKPLQQLFKKFPQVEISSPLHGADSSAGVPLRLAVVLQRCPHYTQQMGSKWGAPGAGGKKCVVQ